jgi:hypothetical protein
MFDACVMIATMERCSLNYPVMHTHDIPASSDCMQNHFYDADINEDLKLVSFQATTSSVKKETNE